MNGFGQMIRITSMNLRSLPQRSGTSAVIVVGIAGVVTVVISVLAMSSGLSKTLQTTGEENRAIVLRAGSTSELVSEITHEAVVTIADLPGIAKDTNGHPLSSPESLTTINLVKKDGKDASAPFRGFTQQAFAVRPEFRIVQGRNYRPAVAELVVGKYAQRLYRGLDIGSRVKLRGVIWTVVGVFEAGGSALDSQLVADLQEIDSAYHRGNRAQSVLVVLESASSFDTFKDSVTSDPRLQVDVLRERDYGAEQALQITRLLKTLAYVVGGIMGIGALFAALNTMYSAVIARTSEIATLRAIGFGSTPIIVSVLVEAFFLAVIGGLAGALIAWGLFDAHTVNTRGGGNAGQLIFDLVVSPSIVMLGIAWSCAIGLVGGLLPAVRAARLQIALGLRSI